MVVENGKIICSGSCVTSAFEQPLEIDLEGGWISPALVSFGSQLGLQEIAMESSTLDGAVLEPLNFKVPQFIDGLMIKAVDGLQFATRDALYVYAYCMTLVYHPPITAG